MSNRHLVIGAGPIGSTVAQRLADQGDRVAIVTRSGTGPDHANIERISADACDADRMAGLATGCLAVYNCVNPTYTTWDTDWPPIAASLLGAAKLSGAVLATVSNLYVYGRGDRPMSHSTPLAPVDHKGEVRAQMWRDALAAHEAGTVPVVEVRGSDYADAGVNSHLSRNAPDVLAGKSVFVMGAADQPHSWTAVNDVAELLVAAAADPSAHGQAWLVPSAPARTQREALSDLAKAAGAPAPKIRTLGPRALRLAGIFSPMMRELSGTAYQFTHPFVLDDSATCAHFGMQPQPWAQTLDGIVKTVRAAKNVTVG
ncbi:MAG: NAD-dependent epimerase/dehydratase family protein [Ornithinimicrobium sp.]